MVDASTSRPSFPLTMKQTLMPCLLQTQQFCVDLATDADISEPLSPVVKLHPTGHRKQEHGISIICWLKCVRQNNRSTDNYTARGTLYDGSPHNKDMAFSN